jgi:pyridoxal phosphate-dependent aminotransferase EpsN
MQAERQVYVIGAGGHAKVVLRALAEMGYTAAAVFDDDAEKHGTTLLGVPVVGPVAALSDRGRVPAVIAVGGNLARQALAKQLDLDWITVVHPRAFVDPTVRLGRGTVVFPGAVIEPDTHVGEHVIVNTGASIDHDCTVGDFAHIAPGSRLTGGVALGEGAMLGAGAIVLPGRQVGAWSTVGAGAVVVRHLGPRMVAVGVPARPRAAAAAAMSRVEPPHTIPIGAPAGAMAAEPPKRIFLSPPHVSGRERELLLDAFDSNWIAPLGPHVDALEREFAAKLGAAEAVALSSGTAALQLALVLLGVGPGDEVITSTLTFAATAFAITYVGATPVFIDSDRRTWNMDPELLAEELDACALRGKLPKAVLSVDLYGQCADYAPILEACRRHGVPLIEDAAEALGARYGDRAAGTLGIFGCFSFNGNKIITTSGGGMLVSPRSEWCRKARFLATQARDPAPHYQHSEIGYNYRMSNLLAAVGRGQLGVLDERIAARRANYAFYAQALGDLPGVEFMPEHPAGQSTRWLTCLTVDPLRFGTDREEIRLALERDQVESRPVWKPMHLQPVFSGCRIRGGRVAEDLFERGLCLPSGSSLTEADRARIVRTVRGICRRPERRAA